MSPRRPDRWRDWFDLHGTEKRGNSRWRYCTDVFRFARILAHYPYVVLLVVFVVTATCLVVCITIPKALDFREPTLVSALFCLQSLLHGRLCVRLLWSLTFCCVVFRLSCLLAGWPFSLVCICIFLLGGLFTVAVCCSLSELDLYVSYSQSQCECGCQCLNYSSWMFWLFSRAPTQ